MTEAAGSLMVMGYGNPGRLDDGLGPVFARRVAALELPGVDVDADYQLNVEDAAAISKYPVAVFADAAVEGPEPFSCTPIEPLPATSFSTHHLEPGQVLGLARSLFNAATRAYVLGIRGYEFNEFGERLSAGARDNLEQALHFFVTTTAEGGWGLDP